MLKHSMRLVIHYLKFWEVPVPYPSYHFNRALAEANRVAKTSLDPTNHTSIQQCQILFIASSLSYEEDVSIARYDISRVWETSSPLMSGRGVYGARYSRWVHLTFANI